MRNRRHLLDETRGGWREAPQAREVGYRDATEMTDEKLIVRIRELDPLVRPLIELKLNEADRR